MCRLPSDPPPGAETHATTRSPREVARNIGVAPFSVSCETTRAGLNRPGCRPAGVPPPHGYDHRGGRRTASVRLLVITMSSEAVLRAEVELPRRSRPEALALLRVERGGLGEAPSPRLVTRPLSSTCGITGTVAYRLNRSCPSYLWVFSGSIQ